MAQEVVDVQGRRTGGAGHVLLLPQRLRESDMTPLRWRVSEQSRYQVKNQRKSLATPRRAARSSDVISELRLPSDAACAFQ